MLKPSKYTPYLSKPVIWRFFFGKLLKITSLDHFDWPIDSFFIFHIFRTPCEVLGLYWLNYPSLSFHHFPITFSLSSTRAQCYFFFLHGFIDWATSQSFVKSPFFLANFFTVPLTELQRPTGGRLWRLEEARSEGVVRDLKGSWEVVTSRCLVKDSKLKKGDLFMLIICIWQFFGFD